MRWVGFHIGQGTTIIGAPVLTGEKRFHRKLSIGDHTYISIKCLFDLAAPIVIGRYVVLSPEVMLFTGTHKIGSAGKRAGLLEPKSITIEDGVWLGARCIVLPGVTVGQAAVVAAGAVVTKDVPSNTLAAGVPAHVIRHLEENDHATVDTEVRLD
jgi:acetyltransferase-like isoleucine patch superfamily enzyme